MEGCLMPHDLLFGRPLHETNNDLIESTDRPTILQSSKLKNIVEYFWSRWSREYFTSLREQHKNTARVIVNQGRKRQLEAS